MAEQMTFERLLTELLVERFGTTTPEHREPPREDGENSAEIRRLDLHDATRRTHPRKRGTP